MNVEQFMIKQGWKKGEGLRPGSIKRALLVKHRKDNKGLGFNPQASEGWWERVFDGHLKSLEFATNGNFKFDEEKRRRETSPLYASFLHGGMLQGTLSNKENLEHSQKKHGSSGKNKKSLEEKKSRKHRKKRGGSEERVSKEKKIKNKKKGRNCNILEKK